MSTVDYNSELYNEERRPFLGETFSYWKERVGASYAAVFNVDTWERLMPLIKKVFTDFQNKPMKPLELLKVPRKETVETLSSVENNDNKLTTVAIIYLQTKRNIINSYTSSSAIYKGSYGYYHTIPEEHQRECCKSIDITRMIPHAKTITHMSMLYNVDRVELGKKIAMILQEEDNSRKWYDDKQCPRCHTTMEKMNEQTIENRQGYSCEASNILSRLVDYSYINNDRYARKLYCTKCSTIVSVFCNNEVYIISGRKAIRVQRYKTREIEISPLMVYCTEHNTLLTERKLPVPKILKGIEEYANTVENSISLVCDTCKDRKELNGWVYRMMPDGSVYRFVMFTKRWNRKNDWNRNIEVIDVNSQRTKAILTLVHPTYNEIEGKVNTLKTVLSNKTDEAMVSSKTSLTKNVEAFKEIYNETELEDLLQNIDANADATEE